MSRVIVKQMFKHPNLRSTSQRNVDHVKYIGTRAGVDKTIGSDSSVNSYVVGEELDYQNESALDAELKYDGDDFVYAKYIDERPNSHGLFGQYGKEDLDAVQLEVKNTNSFVWRTIISLKEEDAVALGFTDKSKWQDMLRKKIPDLAKSMNIPFHNLRWVGAVHMELGHPHVHIMFWEKQPRLKHGIVASEKLDDIRKMLTDEIFKDEREVLLVEKNNLRDLFLQSSVTDVSSILRHSDENEEWVDLRAFGLLNDTVPSRTFENVENMIRIRIEALSEWLPTSGRKSYGYMPSDVKARVNDVVEMICSLPEYESIIAKNESAVRRLTELYTGKDDDIQKAVDNATMDLKKRMSQIVLKGAFAYRDFGRYSVNQEKLGKSVDAFIKYAGRFDFDVERNQISLKVIEKLSGYGLSFDEIEQRLKSRDLLTNSLKEEDVKVAIELGREHLLSLNSKKEVIEALSILKELDYSEAEAFNVLYHSNKNETAKINSYIDPKYYNGALTAEGFNAVVNNVSFSPSDLAILNELCIGNKMGRDTLGVYELLDKDEIAEGIKFTQSTFEYITLDKRVADVFKNGGKFDGDFYYLDDKALSEYLLDQASDEFGINDILSEDDVELIESFDSKYMIITKRLDTLKFNRMIYQDRDTGEFKMPKDTFDNILSSHRPFSFGKYDASVTLSHFTDGTLNLSDIRDIVLEGIEDPAAKEKAYRSLSWRLNKLSDLGILEFDGSAYSITPFGINAQKDVLQPVRVSLRNRLQYLDSLGVLSYDSTKELLKATMTIDNVSDLAQRNGDSDMVGIGKLSTLIHRENGVLNPDLIKERKDYVVTKCFYEGLYDEIESGSINKALNIKNYFDKAIHSFSTMMLSNGKSPDDIKSFFTRWASENGVNDFEPIKAAIERATDSYLESVKWGSVPVVSEKDYYEMFALFSVAESNIPEYYNVFESKEKSFNVNSLMKFLENEAKKDERSNQNAVDSLNRRIKQKAKYATKEGRVTESKKNKHNGISFDD